MASQFFTQPSTLITSIRSTWLTFPGPALKRGPQCLPCPKRLNAFALAVCSVVYRHPAVITNMIASVDAISNDRLELGLGAGWSEEECRAYDMSLAVLEIALMNPMK